MRKIIHIDMDAFFASVEQRDHPEWRGKPLAVGGNEERGVIAAASYEARKFGVRSAMSSRIAKERCPDLIFAKPRFAEYKKVSQQIQTIFHRYSDWVEPLSLDEAYIDITVNHQQVQSGTFIAQSIKNDIFNETGLTASAGVSYNKFLAKMASDQDKPNGLFVIEPKDAKNFLYRLDIGSFFGVGKATLLKMNELGIYRGKDLMRFEERDLVHHFGKSGAFFYKIVRGIDHRKVVPHAERKSIGVENTFSFNIKEEGALWEESKKLLSELWRRIEKSENYGRTLSLKLRTAEFNTYSRSRTAATDVVTYEQILALGVELFNQFIPLENEVRLLGYSISGFDKEEIEDWQTKLEF